ncbi:MULTISPECIES: Crp/Fnr family transcriptional regulator [Streptomyces]|uniref:Crp/Fnr family transcriptional regulator n=1 Tax=Streptomyces TaxID=1883 RepID=UPI0006998CF0|nr:Crp/Fnr family transcriptional regulator [Streptomyces sp. SID7805]MYU56084.1 cyclic nucleotide-binding domain-containing protein [Streptomyces sp. SID7805]
MRQPFPVSELARIPLFSEIDTADLRLIAERVRTVTARKGEVLVEAGDLHRWFYFVCQGHVQLVVSAATAEQKVISLVSAGQTFGDALLFTGRPYPVSVIALSPVTLVAIPHEPVLRLAHHSPGFALRMAGGLAQRLHQLVSDVESYALHNGTQRVLAYLERLAGGGDDGPPLRYPVRVELPTDKGIIASRLSLKPETFSRVLRRLSDTGTLTVDGRRITLMRAPAAGQGLL